MKITLTGKNSFLNKIIKRMNEIVEVQAEQNIIKLYNDIKLATPIDTGYARSRWQLQQTNSPGLSYKISYSPFLLNVFSKEYSISNDAEYIIYLNKGSSQQAPAFFIENTILQNGFTINNLKINI